MLIYKYTKTYFQIKEDFIMTMHTSNGSWTINGKNLTPSDSLYGIIKDAIESNNLNEKYLQQASGHLTQISIDSRNKVIDFLHF